MKFRLWAVCDGVVNLMMLIGGRGGVVDTRMTIIHG